MNKLKSIFGVHQKNRQENVADVKFEYVDKIDGGRWCDICKQQVTGKVRVIKKAGSTVYICDKHDEFYGSSYY